MALRCGWRWCSTHPEEKDSSWKAKGVELKEQTEEAAKAVGNVVAIIEKI